MRKKRSNKGVGNRLLTVAVVMTIGLLTLYSNAFALSGADAVILNVVTVNYTDASGNQSFTANAAATVTVSLVEAGVTLSGRPTTGDTGTNAAAPNGQTVSSGITASYLYAITSNANGDDEYFLDVATDAVANVAGQSISTQLLSADETTVIATNPTSVTLEASVIIDAPAADTLRFPGGTFTGLAAGDILVVNGVDYLVSNVTAGSIASHTHADGNAHGDTGALTTETPVEVALAANANGANTAPSFGSGLVGTLAREQALFRVQVYAEANIVGTDGTVAVDIRTATDSGFGDNVIDLQDTTTIFTAVNLTIEKLVSNVTAGGTFEASATGVSGDVLEYQVTITNNGGDAANVIMTDTVPDYTSLVVAAGNFATYIDPVSNTGDISEIADDENIDDVSGDHDTSTGAMTFYLGDGQNGSTSTGGTVFNGESFVITYRVTID